MNRRHFFIQAACAVGVAKVFNSPASAMALVSGSTASFEIIRTKKQWQARLTDFEYQVMREEKTERAGSSPLLNEKREGVYLCKGCELPLYSSRTKYESGTGWPSFYESLPDAIGTKEDNGFFVTRTEVHCRRCGSHLGHIFDDGPEPTGLRHCLNGVSLVFQAT
ncbi:peptide-methionine (R)-S-oxide reductase MsrB [Marinomonas sp. M1K-6]|uniref:peptide-methionine (R)-S-oxide reductase n=1 Tax=Marinomonas profundi TaxID=2726122 RepID=A0A847R2B1_9GAMM|nr:peptide-methionine (R)-S-oxide reductase MsrB [Marinomonas profundi]NLQ17922.1 peptide-methionine (R)-S-oxide reductase MsrB [Marinomonas profundi]